MFYTLLALRAELRRRGSFDAATQPRLDHLLDLVALGTVADVVKLDANNRILVAQGLKRIRAGRAHPGVAALFSVAGREARKATPFDLGFAAGPRLNAAGRLADMSLGIECLLTDDNGRAWDIAHQLDTINRERRDIEAGMQEAALASLETIDPRDNATLALFNADWHQGVIGIVASRLKEKFFRPTITFAPAGDGMIKGSGRSIPGFHLRDALDLVYKRHPQLIDKFGGHAMAAGLSLREQDFDAFAQAFEQVGREWLSAADLEHVLEHDGPLEPEYCSLDFIAQLDAQVWGQGFAPPLFCDEFRVLNQRVLKERHLKLQLQKDGRPYEAIWFNHADGLPERIRAAYRLGANEYNGRTTVQLMVEFAEAAT
jgi:single-stranded-DNA-specific exonuclease